MKNFAGKNFSFSNCFKVFRASSLPKRLVFDAENSTDSSENVSTESFQDQRNELKEGMEAEKKMARDPYSYKSLEAAHYPPLIQTLGNAEYQPTFVGDQVQDAVAKKEALATAEDASSKEGRARMVKTGRDFLQLYQYDPDHTEIRDVLDKAIMDVIQKDGAPNETKENQDLAGAALKSALNEVRKEYFDTETDRLKLPVLQIPASIETKPMRNQLRKAALDYLRAPFPHQKEEFLKQRTPENLENLKNILRTATAVETGEVYRLPQGAYTLNAKHTQESEFQISKLKNETGFKIYDDPRLNLNDPSLTAHQKEANPPLTEEEKETNSRIAARVLREAMEAAGWYDTRNISSPLDLRDSPHETVARKEALHHKNEQNQQAPIPFMNRREASFNELIEIGEDGRYVPVKGNEYDDPGSDSLNYNTHPIPEENK